jgi:hypothetical protein
VIKNPFQWRRIKDHIEVLRAKLPVLMEAKYPEEQEIIKINNLHAIRWEIEKLEKEIEEYERLDSGDIGDVPPLSTIMQAGDNLTKWRIAKGVSMLRLAKLVKMNPVDLERHEQADWETAPLSLLIHLAMVIENYQEEPSESDDSGPD